MRSGFAVEIPSSFAITMDPMRLVILATSSHRPPRNLS